MHFGSPRKIAATADAIGRETWTMESGHMNAPKKLTALLNTMLRMMARLVEHQMGTPPNKLSNSTTVQIMTPDLTGTLPIYSETEADNFQK